MSLSVFYYILYLRLYLLLLQFQSIFVSFVAISSVLSRCFRAMSLVGISRNRVSSTSPLPSAWAYPRNLTVYCAREGENLNVVLEGWGI